MYNILNEINKSSSTIKYEMSVAYTHREKNLVLHCYRNKEPVKPPLRRKCFCLQACLQCFVLPFDVLYVQIFI